MLPEGDRVLIVKEDNSISIHADKGFKPLNYMTPPLEVKDSTDKNGDRVISFESNKEVLEVTLHEVYNESVFHMNNEEMGLQRDNTEKDVQAYLAANLSLIAPDLVFLEREFETGIGPVDLLAEDANGVLYPIEVKRIAPMVTVSQVMRYVEGLEEQFPNRPIVPVIAALKFKEKTLVLAKKKNVRILEVPENWNSDPTNVS